ncbi:hypothetical protein [Streptomyces sp. NPDC101393]|uniref:hypothetical protein n=1 Tax=Streptomyces sp. NPDC101393 TaxID=3366141 RepID=UPI003813B386
MAGQLAAAGHKEAIDAMMPSCGPDPSGSRAPRTYRRGRLAGSGGRLAGSRRPRRPSTTAGSEVPQAEAIAVAIYGALLTTFTASKITDSVHRAAGPGAEPHEIADQVSTGKITEAAAHAPAADRTDFAHSLITGYDGALHTMLWVLVAVGAVLTVLVVRLLRPTTATAPTT